MAEQQQNQEQVLLKTSFFGGFDKGEVLSYICLLYTSSWPNFCPEPEKPS